MPNRNFVLFAAASLAAFTLTAQAQQGTQNAPDQPTQTTSQQQLSTATPGSQQASPHADDIRRVLAHVTEDAVKGNVKEVADNFVTSSADQFDRSGKKSNLTGPNAQADNKDANKDEVKQLDDQLKQTAKDLNNAWKAKYGHDFNIDRKNEAMVYGGDTFQILKGDMGNAAAGQPRTAGAQVGATGAGLDNTPSGTPAQGATGTARVGDTTVSGSVDTTKDKDHDRTLGDRLAGRSANPAADTENRMATVVAQQSHGAPTISLTLVNEGTFGNRWHIQPSPGLDYRSLAMSLNHHLQEVLNMQAQWPQDEGEAQKMVAHHVLTALAMPPMGAQAGGAGLQNQPSGLNSAQPAGYQSGQQQNQQSQPAQNR